MSFYVVFGDKTVQFSKKCNLGDIQAYFGVESGGLHKHGLGPVVTFDEIENGEAYELQGVPLGIKVLRKVHQKKQASGVTIIEKIEWDYEDIPQEHEEGEAAVIPNTKSSPRGTQLHKRLRNRSFDKTKGKMHIEKEIAKRESAMMDNKPINWIIVTTCSILIILFFLVTANYLHSYDPNLELVLREDADQMTIVSVSILLISLLFGIIAFFH